MNKNKENNNNTINLNESSSSEEENESQEYLDIDNQEISFLDYLKKTSERRFKTEKNSLLLTHKRKNNDNIIIYDANVKEIRNKFCPSIEELDEFLEDCQVEEIDISELEDDYLFDAKKFMEQNHIMKSYLSFEEVDLEEKNESEKNIMKLVQPSLSNSIIIKDNESQYINKIEEENSTANLKNILESEILDSVQKSWLNDYIKKIREMPLKDVKNKTEKLQVIFDLDKTLIFSFVNSEDKATIKNIIENNGNKKMFFLAFKLSKKKMYSTFILRKGIEEFINFTKKFCVFHIRTLSRSPYAKQIIKILERKLGIKFDKIVMRDGRKKNFKKVKSIAEFKCGYIKNKNTVIIDDNLYVWENDFNNVIPSKTFFDKEFGVNCIKDNQSAKNNTTCLLNSHGKFIYHTFAKNQSWKNQEVYKMQICPFYQFKQIKKELFFDVYNGEYLDSKKIQFIYLQNIIKIIYYLLIHDDIPVCDSIKIIRLNIFYGKYFFLKYIFGDKKKILANIIKICGGEIIEPDESITYMMKKIYLVCSSESYDNNRDNIKNEVIKNKNFVLVNEKYILDCYFFMTDLGTEPLGNEYDPESFYRIGKFFFK